MLRVFTHEEIMAVLEAFPTRTLQPLPGLTAHQSKAFTTLYQHDATYLKLVTSLATKGPRAAREAVTSNLARSIKYLLEMTTTPVKSKKTNWGAAWRHTLPIEGMPSQRNVISFTWNFHNVASEIGVYDDPFRNPKFDIDMLAQLRTALATEHKDDAYWRGVTAIFLSVEESQRDTEIVNNNDDFIDWAGHHADIASVIDLARARNTLDVNTLRYLLEAESHAAIGHGVL